VTPVACIEAADLANAVTAFATIFSGLIALALCALVAPQPRRWLWVYAGVVITGIPTVWYHGFGEMAIAGLADSGTNLLLAWLLQVAVLGDYYSRRTRVWVASASGLINLAAVLWRAAVSLETARTPVISFGAFGGFHLTEVVLILDVLLAVALFYIRRSRIPARARPLLTLVTAIFLVGMLLATASNRRVDLQIMAWHALWHVAGAFGFIALWAFNHVRFSNVTSSP